MPLCYGAMPELDEASIRPTRDPPPGRAGDWADAMLSLVQDRDRIAGGMNDLVVHRLFSPGLALEMAMGLMGDHPGAGRFRKPSASWTWRSGISGTSYSLSISLIRRLRAAGLGHFGRCPPRGGPGNVGSLHGAGRHLGGKALDNQFSADGAGPVAGHSPVG